MKTPKGLILLFIAFVSLLSCKIRGKSYEGQITKSNGLFLLNPRYLPSNGLTLTRPSENTIIRLKCTSNLSEYKDPLYVVNGIVMNKAHILSIKPDEIESITVFKDSAFVSKWGVRAINGVIVITTKGVKK